MEYFKLFNLPVSLKVDKMQVLKTYYTLSQASHPDKHIGSTHLSQLDATDMSSKVNEAKRILDNSHLRLEYILKQTGQIQDDEKYTLSPMFLAEMMELNEAIMESKMEENTEMQLRLKARIENEIEQAYLPVKPFFESEELPLDAQTLLKLKEYYYQHKYLKRIADMN